MITVGKAIIAETDHLGMKRYDFLYKGKAYPFSVLRAAEDGATLILYDEKNNPRWFENWYSHPINWDDYPKYRTIG